MQEAAVLEIQFKDAVTAADEAQQDARSAAEDRAAAEAKQKDAIEEHLRAEEKHAAATAAWYVAEEELAAAEDAFEMAAASRAAATATLRDAEEGLACATSSLHQWASKVEAAVQKLSSCSKSQRLVAEVKLREAQQRLKQQQAAIKAAAEALPAAEEAAAEAELGAASAAGVLRAAQGVAVSAAQNLQAAQVLLAEVTAARKLEEENLARAQAAVETTEAAAATAQERGAAVGALREEARRRGLRLDAEMRLARRKAEELDAAHMEALGRFAGDDAGNDWGLETEFEERGAKLGGALCLETAELLNDCPAQPSPGWRGDGELVPVAMADEESGRSSSSEETDQDYSSALVLCGNLDRLDFVYDLSSSGESSPVDSPRGLGALSDLPWSLGAAAAAVARAALARKVLSALKTETLRWRELRRHADEAYVVKVAAAPLQAWWREAVEATERLAELRAELHGRCCFRAWASFAGRQARLSEISDALEMQLRRWVHFLVYSGIEGACTGENNYLLLCFKWFCGCLHCYLSLLCPLL
jgi:hypothetical protein